MLTEAARPDLTGDARTDAIESRRRAAARWANGYNIPNERSTRAIAAALDVDPDTLLALRPARPRPEPPAGCGAARSQSRRRGNPRRAEGQSMMHSRRCKHYAQTSSTRWNGVSRPVSPR